jgi:hypothetical protein
MTSSIASPIVDQSFERMTSDDHVGATLDSFVSPRSSTAERHAEGKALRRKVPREG